MRELRECKEFVEVNRARIVKIRNRALMVFFITIVLIYGDFSIIGLNFKFVDLILSHSLFGMFYGLVIGGASVYLLGAGSILDSIKK